ncbi:MAG: hypothetical protein IV084_00605 [Rugosibacter sp.]|nr:hypothetical protein [Rugosibacter sp.]
MVQPVVKHYASRQIANGFNSGAVSPAPTFLLTAQINPHHRETTGAQHGLQRPTDGRIFWRQRVDMFPARKFLMHTIMLMWS